MAETEIREVQGETNDQNESADARECRCRLKWKPTSSAKLAEVEQRILKSVKSTLHRQFVDLKDKEVQIWTVIANKHLTATPLVMVHGMGGGLGMWVQNIDPLAQNRPVYTFDLLGFGRSSRPTFSSDAEEAEDEFVHSLEEWRQNLGLEKFVLLGHSLGGFVSSAYALKHPERVEHLIVADPWGYPEKPDDVSFRAPLWARALFRILKPFNPFSAVRAAGPLGPGIIKKFRSDLKEKFADSVDDDDDLLLQYIYHCNARKPSGEIAAKTLQTMVRWAKNPIVSRIGDLHPDVPMTFIHGEDSWLPKDVGYSVKNIRSDSYVDVKTISEAGHHVYADQPDEFNNMVKKICDGVDKTNENNNGL